MSKSKHARFDEKVEKKAFVYNADIEKVAQRPDQFEYSGKYRWIQRSRRLTSFAVRFETKYIEDLDWTPIFVGSLIFAFVIFGLTYLCAKYFSPLGVYIVQKNLLGPR